MAATSEPRKLILHVVYVGAGLANIIEVKEDEESGIYTLKGEGGSLRRPESLLPKMTMSCLI